jgi:hypothetical protein
MLAVFLAGTAWSLRGRPLKPLPVLTAVIGGLFGLVVFQFTVGNLWAYAVEYHNAGGSWTDPPFVAPFAVAVVAGAATYVFLADAAAAAWAAFWTFAVAAGVVAVVVNAAAGYREAGG